MYEAGFRLESFDALGDLAKCAMMHSLVEALAAVDTAYLMNHQLPRLYQSGVRYEVPKGKDTHDGSYQAWRDVPGILRTMRGTCMELAAWRLAELRLFEGFPRAVPLVTCQTDPRIGVMFHTKLQDSDTGVIEDPSVILGMGNDEWRPFYRS